MPTSSIEKKINDYLVRLSQKQKKAVLTVTKTFAEEQDGESSVWDDKEFVAEIERRSDEMESGKVKSYNWQEVKQRARLAIKNKKRK
jgi:hypothetical protein